jgi:hypothetical protein
MNNRKFGIELECFNVAINQVVYALRNVGINAHSSSYSGREYSVWQIKTDGSIQGVNAFEVVSPILEGEAGISETIKVCKVLEQIGAKVNKTCGFHIHHSAVGYQLANFKNLFKRFVKYETAIDSLQPESRRANNNRYCMSNVTDNIIGTFRAINNCTNVRDMANLFSSRYVKLNFQSFVRMGTIEFRNHAGTIDAVKVENYIRLTGAMMEASACRSHCSAPKVVKTAKESLTILLEGLEKRKLIDKKVSSFYKARAVKLETV